MQLSCVTKLYKLEEKVLHILSLHMIHKEYIQI